MSKSTYFSEPYGDKKNNQDSEDVELHYSDFSGKSEDFKTVTITLEAYHNITNIYPTANIKTQCQFNDKDLGESCLTTITDEPCLTLNHSFSFKVDEKSLGEMDNLVSTPAICETSFTETLLIKPIENYKDERMYTYKTHPKITVTVSIEGSFNLKNPVIMNFTLESVLNIPSVMKMDMDYRICWMLPPSEDSYSGPFLFTNPHYKTSRVTESSKFWPGLQKVGDATATKYKINEADEILCKFEKDIGVYLESKSPRLEFNVLKRNLLLQDGMNSFAAHVKTYRNIVLEFYMISKLGKKPSLTGSLKDKSVPNFKAESSDIAPARKGRTSLLHLMAVVEVSSLLQPGVTKLRTAVPLRTFSQEEANKLGGLENSYFASAQQKKQSKPNEKDVTVVVKKEKKSKEKLSGKSTKSSQKDKDKERNIDLSKLLPPKPEEPPEPELSTQVFNEDGKPCFIIVEMELSKPILPSRNLEDLSDELEKLLNMKTETSSKIVLSGCLTRNYYKEILNEIIQDMNKKFQRFLEQNPNYKVRTYRTPSEFTKFLRNIGSYQEYLNSLTTAAMLLVSNNFKYENDTNDPKSYQNFIGEVFVYLVSEMHQTVNELICNRLEPPTTPLVVPEDRFIYAKEAIQLGQVARADRFLLERICSDAENPDYWFDYAVFHLEVRNMDRAFECVKEALSKKSTHRYSLMLFGILLDDKGYKEDAEMCFLNLMVQDPKWLEGWGVLYLFYYKHDTHEGMDWAMEMTKKHIDDQGPADYFGEFEDLAWTGRFLPKTVFLRTAILLLKMRAYDWAEIACSQEVKLNYGFVNYLLAAICLYKGLYSHAKEHIDEANAHELNYAITALSGHCLLAMDRKEEAQKEYSHVLELPDRPDNIHMVYINCARILEELGDTQEARKLMLLACKSNTTPYTWFKTGQLYFMQNDLLSAEECFSKSNSLDNRNAVVWGYLTLVNLKLSRLNEAELCYLQAVKNKLDDNELLEQIQTEWNKETNA